LQDDSERNVNILSSYLPRDRRHALARGQTLPDRARGAVLFADISGFTRLTEGLAISLGPQRGAEEITRHLNRIYELLIEQVDCYGGSVINFSGDAITCWFDGDDAQRAVTCAFAMHQDIDTCPALLIPGGERVKLTMKVGIAVGPVRRFTVGDPQLQLVEVVAGQTLGQMAGAEHHAQPAEIVLSAPAAANLADKVSVKEWRAGPAHDGPDERFAVVGRLLKPARPQPWPVLAGEGGGLASEGVASESLRDKDLTDEQVRPWILPSVYARLREGQGEFLAQLRPSVALFMRFGGLDYDDDPDVQAKLDQCVRWVQHTVSHYEGNLLQLTIGDKGSYLYAVFGVPVAHGDDAARATAAALELRQPPAELGQTTVQFGIAHGQVWSGAYGGSTRTFGAMGDAVNLAARLMETAPTGQILVSADTAAAIESHFVLEPLPPVQVKGKRAAVPVFAVHGGRSVPAIKLQEPRYALPMVGREAEISLIEQRMAQASAGHGQIIGIVAEAGIGKSRLVAEVIARATKAGFDGYGGECSSYGTRTAYLAWQPIWRALFNLDSATPSAAPQAPPAVSQVQTLADSLSQIDPALVALAPLLGPVVGMTLPDNDVTRAIDVRARKGALENLLLQVIRFQAGRRRLLLVIEDAHWMDSLSADLLETIGRAAAELPVLIVIAYRPPEPSYPQPQPQLPGVASLGHFTQITLGDFTPAEAAQLIRMKTSQLFGAVQVPESFNQRLAALAQGNPFYIEELLNYLKDQHIDLDDAAALEEIDLPGSLSSLILSRIDTLSESQQATTKVASVIGRRFLVTWLWGVYPALGSTAHVRDDLTTLDKLGLTVFDTPEPELAYLFKHILTQEVAYQSLTHASRAAFHGHLAGWLERTLPPNDLPVDLLAYHYGHSDNRAKELQYASLAAEHATGLGAYAEAIAYLHRALELLGDLPDTGERTEKELALQLNLGTVLINTRGQASLEAKACYDRARELCQTLPQTPQLARALFGLWTFYLFRGELGTTYELAQQCFNLAQEERFGEFRLQAHAAMANTYFWMGAFKQALEHVARVMALYDPSQHRAYIVRYAQNPRVTVQTTGVVNLWITGHPDQALAGALESLVMARKLNHGFSIVMASQPVGVVYLLRGEPDHMPEYVQSLVDTATRHKIALYAAVGTIQQAWLKVEQAQAQGQPREGIEQLRAGLDTLTALGDTLLHSLYVNLLAEACLRHGLYEDGLQVLDKAIEGALPNRRHAFLAEMYRLKGELLLAQSAGDTSAGEQWLLRALDLARQQEALSFELRTAMTLARLWVLQGKAASARDLLAPVHARFTEGHSTRDLRMAAALLAEL
jgi:predicted ATPase/class 3 adenylate cyclase